MYSSAVQQLLQCWQSSGLLHNGKTGSLPTAVLLFAVTVTMRINPSIAARRSAILPC
jgi:hypothetical protein